MQHAEASSSIVTAHARIEPKLRSQLAALARANDRSIAAEIRTAIREHVEREHMPAANPRGVSTRPTGSSAANAGA